MEINRVKLSKEEFDKARLLYPCNVVIVEIPNATEEKKTKSGIVIGFNKDIIYVEGDDNHVADVADVYGIVVKVPERYYFSAKEQMSPSWDTDIDVMIGDVVWFNVLAATNCEELYVEGKIYRIIPYEDLFVAKRGNEVICLNGNVILSPVYKEKISALDVLSEQEIDSSKGIVRFVGKCNKEYCDHTYADFPDIEVGDVVLIDKRHKLIPLERKKYNACFDDDNLYYATPRRFITMVIPR